MLEPPFRIMIMSLTTFCAFDNSHDDNGALSALEDAIMLADSYQEKYEQEPSAVANAHPEPSSVAAHHLCSQSTNWDFVENRIANLNQGDSISWNAVCQQGKA
ncbi:hypothetical protein DFQ30_006549 [Apophysomyces sp. BC1015]|nr:hypothetical protein DFQ30_006549 [Apophysomyces sp. BC1015]